MRCACRRDGKGGIAELCGLHRRALEKYWHDVVEGLGELVEMIKRERESWKALAMKVQGVEIGPKVPATAADRSPKS